MRASLALTGTSDGRPDDVERDGHAERGENAHDVRQDSQALSRIDAAHGQQANRLAAAGVSTRGEISGADRRCSRFEYRMVRP
jgi:hypothetical protein